jgi:hypothetical protein
MRRNSHGDAGLLGGDEQTFDVLHRLELLDAFADDTPGHALRTQKIDLRISHHEGRPLQIELHGRRRERRLRGWRVLVSPAFVSENRQNGCGGNCCRAGLENCTPVHGSPTFLVGVLAHGDLLFWFGLFECVLIRCLSARNDWGLILHHRWEPFFRCPRTGATFRVDASSFLKEAGSLSAGVGPPAYVFDRK